jgi:hypothetical protein
MDVDPFPRIVMPLMILDLQINLNIIIIQQYKSSFWASQDQWFTLRKGKHDWLVTHFSKYISYSQPQAQLAARYARII